MSTVSIKLRIFGVLGMLLPFIPGCEETVREAGGMNPLEVFYPLEIGTNYYYHQDSIVLLNEVAGIRYDTSRAEIRETLIETFVGADGQTWYRGERFGRRSDKDPWTYRAGFTVNRTDRQLLYREGNLTFTKLVLPATRGNGWDGHVDFDDTRRQIVGGEFLAIYQDWDYRYDSITPDQLFVEQASVDNLLDLRRAYEVYTRGIGLTERFVDARATQCVRCCNRDTGPCMDLPWNEKAEKGFILHQTFLRQD